MNIKLAIYYVLFMSLGINVSIAEEARRFYTGNELIQWCETESTVTDGFCFNYLAGVSDTHNLLYAEKEIPKKLYCTPLGVKFGQLRRVFLKYANDNPQDLHLSASRLVLKAFVHSFPCND